MKKINTEKQDIFFKSQLLPIPSGKPFIGFTIYLNDDFYSLIVPIEGNQFTAEISIKRELENNIGLHIDLLKADTVGEFILDLLWEYKAQAEKYKQSL